MRVPPSSRLYRLAPLLVFAVALPQTGCGEACTYVNGMYSAGCRRNSGDAGLNGDGGLYGDGGIYGDGGGYDAPPVVGSELTSITVSPATLVIGTNQTQEFLALGHYSDGTLADLTAQAVWMNDGACTMASNILSSGSAST